MEVNSMNRFGANILISNTGSSHAFCIRDFQELLIIFLQSLNLQFLIQGVKVQISCHSLFILAVGPTRQNWWVVLVPMFGVAFCAARKPLENVVTNFPPANRPNFCASLFLKFLMLLGQHF
jgi:hypothetical protein